MDVDVGSHEILLTTRVGVMRTTPDIQSWTRDLCLPPDTKRIATWAIETEYKEWESKQGASFTYFEIDAVGKRLVQIQHQTSVVLIWMLERMVLSSLGGGVRRRGCESRASR